MPCEPVDQMTEDQRAIRARDVALATAELEQGLKSRRIQAVKDARGNVTFRGWSQESRRGCCDACTYRRLVAARSQALQMALQTRQAATVTR